MDEQSIENALQMYKSQLSQVDTAIQAAGTESNSDLVKLKADLQELIMLTEESLLSLKKSKLMSMFETPSSPSSSVASSSQALSSSSSSAASSSSSSSSTSSSSVASRNQQTPSHGKQDCSLDAEFAAFQAAISGEAWREQSTPGSAPSPPAVSPRHEPQDEDRGEVDFEEITGTKCRVPHSHDWGEMRYHSAMVLCAEPLVEDEKPKVRVLFINPTHLSMKPCPFFLEGRCRFSEEECKLSHGYVVDVDQLEEYTEPDYSEVRLGSTCYALYEDELWYKALVVDLHDDTDQFSVTYDNYDEVCRVDKAHVLPLENGNDSSDEDALNDKDKAPFSGESSDSEDDEDVNAPGYLWQPSVQATNMANWEAHTKGFGSKIMAQMGYVVGEGLGRSRQGRTEPVPIQLLPPGKSLDEIMKLKERAGNKDLYDVLKKMERRKKFQINSSGQDGHARVPREKAHVFDFINKKLGGKKGKIEDLAKHDHLTKTSKRHISEIDLTKKSERSLNVQLLKTQEEIRNVEKNLEKLQYSYRRNVGKDHRMANQVKAQISQSEAYLERLKSSEQLIHLNKNNRKITKKLTIF